MTNAKPAPGTEQGTLCLNMIVKNEMANLERCLASVAPYIGCWVIGDTGSTDGTQDFVMAFFAERGLSGELHSFPFENFEQARNAALDHAYATPLAYDYLLFCDADMELVVEDLDFRTRLEAPGYRLIQRTAGGLVYWNTRLVRRDAGARYHGVTHEYVDVPGDVEQLDGVWYRDHASGANRTDKFERDIRLLAKALEAAPDNRRYWFYLAQSYKDAGHTAEAAETYAKRAQMGGWEEEAWYAQMMQARCLRDLGDEGGFLREALAAFNRRPTRAEPLYDLAKFYRERSMNEASVLFSQAGLAVARPEDDVLFLEDFVYTAGLREEYSIAANYSRDPAGKDRGFAACNWLALSRDVPEAQRNLARGNLLFYIEPACKVLPSFNARPVAFNAPDGYRPSNPSVARRGEKILLVQRAVNYTVTGDREYQTPDGTPVHTRNFLLQLNGKLETQSAKEILPPVDFPEPQFREILGFEDLRLFAWRGELWCSACVRQLTPEGWCEQVLARIDDSAPNQCRLTDWRVLRPRGSRRHEKNWMPQVKPASAEAVGERLQFIYLCDPTRIVDAEGQTIRETTPPIAAENFCGGSQLIEFAGGWLALVHEARVWVSTGARNYRHRFVWFDDAGLLRGVSRQFYFHQKGLEFAAGLTWHSDGEQFLVSYGIGDGESWIATVDPDDVRRLLEDVQRLPWGLPPIRDGSRMPWDEAVEPDAVANVDSSGDFTDAKGGPEPAQANIKEESPVDGETLASIFRRYGTDKVTNGYAEFYDSWFRKDRLEIEAVLEIGIGTLLPRVHSSMAGYALEGYRPGGSLKSWREFFPNATIYGVDVQPDTQMSDEERVVTFLCNSTDCSQVERLAESIKRRKFDVIIDDGSHILADQVATYRNFFPFLKENGTYIVEDIVYVDRYQEGDDIRSIIGDSNFFFAGPQNNLLVITKGGSTANLAGPVDSDGNDEEAWYSLWRESRRLRDTGDEERFVTTALEASRLRPHRGEPLHDLAWYYLGKSRADIAVKYAEAGLALPFPRADRLGAEQQVYKTGLKETFSIAANYSKDADQKDRGFAACNWLALSRDVPAAQRDLARSNLYHYLKPASAMLPSFAVRPVTFTPPDGYHPMNPSVTRHGDELVLAQRCVNYTLRDGQYLTPDGAPIHTRNFLLRLGEGLEVRSAAEILPPADLPAPSYELVKGFEDLRLFAWRGGLWCVATVRELTPEGWCEQLLARLDESTPGPVRLADWRLLHPPGPRLHEKNWMPLAADNDLRFIYLCDPTRIVDEEARPIAEGTPDIAAEQFSGGSQAILFDGGWLALVHEARAHSGSPQRTYQHRFVWLDAAHVLRRVSRPFFFHQKDGVEFAAGLAWHPDGKRLLVSYGVADRESWLATVNADNVRAALEDVAQLPCGLPAVPAPTAEKPDEPVAPAPSVISAKQYSTEETFHELAPFLAAVDRPAERRRLSREFDAKLAPLLDGADVLPQIHCFYEVLSDAGQHQSLAAATASMRAAGHPVRVWSYSPEKLEFLRPYQVELRQAADVLPKGLFERIVAGSEIRYFSDIFRYAVLYEHGGLWMDTDVVLLRPFPFRGDHFLNLQWRGGHTGHFICGNVMYARPFSHHLRNLYEMAMERFFAAPGANFGDIGPKLLSDYVASAQGAELRACLGSPVFFNPIDWTELDRFNQSLGELADYLNDERVFGIHLWNAKTNALARGEGSSLISLLSDPLANFPRLIDLADRFRTDKNRVTDYHHGYSRIYDRLLSARRLSLRRLMEIGLSNWNLTEVPSVEMWLNYFPFCKAVGVDRGDFSALHNGRFSTFVCDQSKREQVCAVAAQLEPKSFDLIIDDGSHASFDQQMTFREFFPLLAEGGWYFIEDLDWTPPDEDHSKITPTKRLLREIQLHGCAQSIDPLDVSGLYGQIAEMLFFDSHHELQRAAALGGLAAIRKRGGIGLNG